MLIASRRASPKARIVSADGKYLLRGDLFDLTTGRDLTEDARRADRLAAIEAIGIENAIEFASASPAATRSVVTVFANVDCGYCRRLRSQIGDYNARRRGALPRPAALRSEYGLLQASRRCVMREGPRGGVARC